ncbi:hypothetical protein ElyMa_005119700, partial [Elysia marginata]
MASRISNGNKAICVDFHYTTNGSSTVPINILIQEGAVYKPAHQVLANTRGKWESSSFSCCLPQQKDTRFAIEATSTADGIPAIDQMDVRLSNMPCENGKLVCYPSLPDQTPLDPATGPRCSSDQVEPAVPSCEFNADDKKILEDCGWEVSSAWEVRQKIDGSGRYDVISSTSKDDATLLSEIGDDVVSFCLEIQFTVPDIRGDLRNVLSVFIVIENSTEWGQSYNYFGKDKTVWKRNNFEGLLPEGKNRKLQINSKIEGLQIDYIHIRTSDLTPTVPPTKLPGKDDTIQTMYLTSDVLPSASNSNQGWIEMRTDNTTSVSVHGKIHQLWYEGTEKTVVDDLPRLTTKTRQKDNCSMISFRYTLSGNARLEVVAKDDIQREVLVWETEDSAFSQFKIIFKIFPPANPTDKPVWVNFRFFP